MRVAWVVLLVGLLVGLLAGIAWWLRHDGAPAPPTATVTELPLPKSLQQVRPASDSPTRREHVAEPVAAAGPDAADDTVFATITGRCVRQEDGAGCADCRIELDRPGADTLVARSDGRGTFSLAVPTASDSYHLTVSANGRVTRYRDLDELRAGATEDLGELPMQRGFLVPGQLVDTEGAPVADVHLTVAGFDNQIPAGHTRFGASIATTDAAGRFTFDGEIPHGTWQIQLQGDYVLLEDRFSIVGDQAPTLQLVVRALSRIQGQVLGPDDHRMTHIVVATADRAVRAETNAVGDFVLRSAEPRHGPVDLVVDDGANWPDAPRTRAHWGDHGIVIRLPETPPIEVEVVDDRGEPVERFGHRFAKGGRASQSAPPEDHPEGRLRLQPGGRGTFVLRVFPESERWAASPPHQVLVTATRQPRLRVTVPRLDDATVQVLDADGTPAAGVEVTLFRTYAGVAQHTGIVDLRRPMYHHAGDHNERVSGGRSDGRGRLTIPTPRDPTGLLLRVRQGNARPDDTVATALARERRQTLVLQRYGQVVGRVELRGADHRDYVVGLFDADGIRVEGASTARLKADGSFRSPPLRVGSYRVRLMNAMAVSGPHTSMTSFVPCRVDGALLERRATVAADTPAEVTFAVPQRTFGRLRGRLVPTDGAGLPATVWLEYADYDLGARGEFAVDAHGDFHATGLQPGRYRVAVGRPVRAGVLAEVVTVVAGQTVAQSFHYEGRTVRVDLLDARGAPVERTCWVRYAGRTRRIYDGRSVTFACAPTIPVAFARTPEGPWTAASLLDQPHVRVTLP
ncbi:MAG: carboxypeptidase-like regulatory domain-containing protein [Planctomycetota bacterium]